MIPLQTKMSCPPIGDDPTFPRRLLHCEELSGAINNLLFYDKETAGGNHLPRPMGMVGDFGRFELRIYWFCGAFCTEKTGH